MITVNNPFTKEAKAQLAAVSGAPLDEICFTDDYKINVNSFKRFIIPDPNLASDTLAIRLASQFRPATMNESISSLDHGWLNLNVRRGIFIRWVTSQVLEQKELWGSNDSGAGKTVVVEYSSPNIAKPFHAGHLRSTIIGNFIANIHRFCGYKLHTINYLGDWGKQYGLLAVGFQKYGSHEELAKNPIAHLFDIYVKINKDAKTNPDIHDEARAYFGKMEQGDPEAINLWLNLRNLSIEKYKEIYPRLNITFDEYSGESVYSDHEQLEELVEMLDSRGLLEVSDKALIVPTSSGNAIVKKKDGTSIYLTRDILAAVDRYLRFRFDKMLYIVSSQQDDHFRKLFEVLSLSGYQWASRCQHIQFGMVDGMRTREGEVVFLESILDEAERVMLKTMNANDEKAAKIQDKEETARIMGNSAVLMQDFNAKREKGYKFDLERNTATTGNTGPFLQYTHARLASIEAETGVEITDAVNFELLSEDIALDLAKIISVFPEIVARTLAKLEAVEMGTYLYKLAHKISVALNTLWVKDREPDLQKARALLLWSARVTLGNGLKLLGITPLNRV